MPLKLRVISAPNAASGVQGEQVFRSNGTIGRTPENSWVLPDPDRMISSLHARIAHENGRYYLIDESTNGTSVNDRPLGKGTRVELHAGDRITIGRYEISAALEQAFSTSSDGGSLRDLFPGDGLPPLVQPGPPPTPPRSGNTGHHPVPPQNHAFVPPSVHRAEPVARPAPPPRPDLPPENEQWWLPNAPAPAIPPAAPAASNHAALPPENEQWWLPNAPAPPTAPAPEPVPVAPPTRPSPAAAPPAAAPLAAAPLAAAPPAPTRPEAGPGDRDAAALIAATLGLDAAALDAATLRSIGEVVRVVVEGMLEVLKARAMVKNQFRVAMTTLKPLDNNPLKFSATTDDALFNLFVRRSGSFSSPVGAFREAFDDLKTHQLAMLAGMRAAFAELMKQFDPERLQEGFDRGLKRGAIFEVMNKTKYWDLYRELYASFGDDDETFKRLFGDEFARAYDEQLRRLTAAHGKS